MKVKFNLPTKRYNSKFSNDFNSTFDFGYIQSSLTKFVVPKSKFSINVSQLVRTAPLVVPTFGRMAVHNLFTYVPMSLIFPAFDAFISQTMITGAIRSYKPNSLPCVTNNMLVCMLLSRSLYTQYIAYSSNNAGQRILYRKFSYYNGATISIPDDKPFALGYSELGSRVWDYHIFIEQEHYEGFYKLNETGRSLYNVLRSLGYSMDYYDTAPVSVLPILAFIKASYDLLFPKRDLAWHTTKAYDLINKYYNGDFVSLDDGNGHLTDFFVSPIVISNTLMDALISFVSAPIGRNLSNIATAQPILDDNVPSYRFPTTSGSSKDGENVGGKVYGSNVGGSVIDNLDGLSSESIRIADKLWSFLQRSSVVGQDVANWFKVHFGVKPTEDMFSHSWLIRDVVNRLNVNTVVSTADTQSSDRGEVLGGLAGQSYSAASAKVSFEAPNFGYLLCLSYVIPVCGLSSGTQPELYNTSYFDMPFPDFDGLGYEALNNTSFQEFEGPAKSNNYTQGFGYVPRMTSFKTLNNVRSGGFALPSLRDNYLPYCLDNVNIQSHKTIGSESLIKDFDVTNSQTLAWYFPYGHPGSDIAKVSSADNPWRVFNNIFYNSFDEDIKLGLRWSPNNFMVQSSFDVIVSSYLKPISDSYELNQLGKHLTSVDKS